MSVWLAGLQQSLSWRLNFFTAAAAGATAGNTRGGGVIPCYEAPHDRPSKKERNKKGCMALIIAIYTVYYPACKRLIGVTEKGFLLRAASCCRCWLCASDCQLHLFYFFIIIIRPPGWYLHSWSLFALLLSTLRRSLAVHSWNYPLMVHLITPFQSLNWSLASFLILFFVFYF